TRDNIALAATEPGGQNIYNFADAAVILALDSDFLYLHPAAVAHARDFANARRMVEPGDAQMNRLYVAEPTPTITGANADHRVAVAARDVLALVNEIAAQLEISGAPSGSLPAAVAAAGKWIAAVVHDLSANRGASLVIAGETQPPAVHSIVERINAALGNIGVTISPRPPVAANPVHQIDSLRRLVADIDRGTVEVLIILGGNPVYDAPADFSFASALEKVKLCVHHSIHANETSTQCHWHIPATHFLESWSDALAFDGTATIIQPLIEPLYDGISLHQLLAALALQPVRLAYDIVRETWRATWPSANFEQGWRETLNHGVTRELHTVMTAPIESPSAPMVTPHEQHELEILFRPDPNVLDGYYTNNSWLQELPKPFSKLTWDNA